MQFRPLSETKFINDANLVAYWKLDGNSNDSKGSNNGTDTNVSYVAGKYGQCASLNGSSSFFTVTNPSIQLNNFTLSFNIKTTSTTYSTPVDNGWFTEGVNVFMEYQNNGTFNIGIRDGGTVTQTANTTKVINDGSWHNIVITADGVNLKIYVDGLLDKSNSSNISATTSTTLYFGRRASTSDFFFNGLIDDIAIFSRALSASEVNELYQGMTLGEYLPNSSTKLLLHLNGNSTDSSGNGNNGVDTDITYVDGKFGKCASFNGTSSNIAIADNNTLDFGTGDFTFITWLYPTNFPSSNARFVLSKGGGAGNSQYWLRIENSSGQLRFLTAQGSSITLVDADATTALTLNTWQMVAVGRRGTTHFININGKDVKTTVGTVRNCDNSDSFIIGLAKGGGECWSGSQDEFFAENRGWTQTELAKHYTYAKGRFGII